MRLLALPLACLLSAGAAGAQDFAIELKVQTMAAVQAAQAEAAALGVKPKARAVLRLKAKERLRVDWTMTNVSAGSTFKNVLVHFVAVKQDKLGQLNVPKLDRGVVAERAVTVDFNPKESARGGMAFAIATPGFYLVRLETIGVATPTEGHEYFAAVDVVVE
jgi:hypothetical protein